MDVTNQDNPQKVVKDKEEKMVVDAGSDTGTSGLTEGWETSQNAGVGLENGKEGASSGITKTNVSGEAELTTDMEQKEQNAGGEQLRELPWAFIECPPDDLIILIGVCVLNFSRLVVFELNH